MDLSIQQKRPRRSRGEKDLASQTAQGRIAYDVIIKEDGLPNKKDPRGQCQSVNVTRVKCPKKFNKRSGDLNPINLPYKLNMLEES